MISKRLNNLYETQTFSVKGELTKNRIIKYKLTNKPTKIEESLRYYVETKGQFQAYINKDNPWFTDKDISNAQASFDATSNTPVLRLSLSNEAALKLKNHTQSHINKILVIEFEGKIIAEARITQPLSKYLQISITESKQAIYRIADLLKSGALPEKVQFVSLSKL